MTIRDLIYVAVPNCHIYIAGTGCEFRVMDLLPTLEFIPGIKVVSLDASDIRSIYIDTDNNYEAARTFLDMTYQNGGCTFKTYLEMEQIIDDSAGGR